MEYKRASEAEAIATGEVIPRWHAKKLRGKKVAYVLVERIPDKAGRAILATIKKASGLDKHLHGYDLVLKVNKAHWGSLTARQRLALLDHEFQHVALNDENELVMVGHDLEEFRVIVARHGLWKADVEAFAGTIRSQLNLFGSGRSGLAVDPHTGEVRDAADVAVESAGGKVTETEDGGAVVEFPGKDPIELDPDQLGKVADRLRVGGATITKDEAGAIVEGIDHRDDREREFAEAAFSLDRERMDEAAVTQ